VLKGNEFEGTFSNGMVELEFKGRNHNYFSGKAEGQLKADKLIVNFRIRAATACTYQFDLPRS